MKCVGFRLVRLASLKLPGGMRAVRDELATAEIQSSYEWTGGAPAEPVLIDSDLRLRAGRHRVAACMNLGSEAIPAMVFEGSEDELARLTDVENAYRRHDPGARDAALARLVGAATKTLEPEGGSSKPPIGRPLTPEGKAIREVAKATGSSPEAVKSAVRRVKEKERAEEEPEAPDPIVVGVKLEGWGLPIPEDVQRNANLADVGLRELRTMVHQAQRGLAELRKSMGENEKAKGVAFLRLDEGLKQAAYEASAEIPVAVCYACKAIPAPRSKCMTCYRRGFVGKEQLRAASPEQREKGAKAGVYVDGQWLTVEQARRLKP